MFVENFHQKTYYKMKYLNYNQQAKLRELVNQIQDKYRLNYYNIDYSFLAGIYDMAVYNRKVQNTYLKEYSEHDIVKTIKVFSECSGQVEEYNIRAKKRWTKYQWFVLLYMVDCFASIEQIRKELN